jgi:3-hydroxybutyryl-CoA dehydrogenase
MVLTAERIGVVGAGMMGAEIALVFALAGRDVRLNDATPERIDAALANLKRLLKKGRTRGFWSDEQAESALGRLRSAPDLAEFADRDFVIEAVFEDEAVKAEVFRKLDDICAEGCLIASNTSSISITVLSSHLPAVRRPYFLGTHFFSPASRMKLVEVIPGLDTSAAAVDAAIAACTAAGKTAIPVKDVVGFAINRLLHAFLIEAIRIVEEGAATPADIDTACRLGLGHPIGPFEMMDLVSNSLVLQVQTVLTEAYGDRFRPPPRLKQMVKAGYDGRRAGRGWTVQQASES